MQKLVYKTYEQLSEAVAYKMVKLIIKKPNAVFCLASGSSPQLAYQYFTEKLINKKINYSNCTFIALDEWVGIPPTDSGSCHYFLQENIVKPLNIASDKIHYFDGLSKNLELECIKIDTIIEQNNGLDIIIVGIGLNGHIGFNEPGVSPDKKCHVIDLEDITINVGQKYFDQPTQLSQGITIGLQHFMEANEAILIANGLKKAEIIFKTLNAEINMQIPSTIIRKHRNASVMIDLDADNN